MRAPVFSIVIPTYNRSELLPFAIKSVLDQTFSDFEIIVSDNRSTDGTEQVVQQFDDPRLTWVQPPSHLLTVDNFEFARRKARGQLILMLGDDDALISTALERFFDEFQRTGSDFMFSSNGEYMDRTYPGPNRNSLSCPAFTGSSSVVSGHDYLEELFSFRFDFETHPTSYVFAKNLADDIAERCGRFFLTNGVEYFAWTAAARFARKIVRIDVPLAILGRTGRSLGANLVLCNPGKEQIESFVPEWNSRSHAAPLSSLVFVNFMADGVLTAKKLFPEEFEDYELNEPAYLRGVLSSIRKREALGVDMSKEMEELEAYLDGTPGLKAEVYNARATPEKSESKLQDSGFKAQMKTVIRPLIPLQWRKKISNYRLGRRIRQGEVRSGFRLAGDDFGFSNAFEAAALLKKAVSHAVSNPEGPAIQSGRSLPSLGQVLRQKEAAK